MEEMNNLPEEQNNEEVKEQSTPAPEEVKVDYLTIKISKNNSC